ncbi:GTPase domain-containing protein [Janibacter sp. GXQ6167]|uniref:GTPase domain-containing protein n=1 Tax=Janibacter sp. GXQ6167 TaxID=3240791 RepID=UPI003523DA1D
MNRPSMRLNGPARAAIGTTIASTAIPALASARHQVSQLLHGRFPAVAVTGMTGVGKTRLADRLARRSTPDAAAEVGSATMERRTRRSAKGKGFRFRVVPGDNAATRLGALDEVFHDEPVDGVLHVVAYGHATARRTAGTTGHAEATRDQQLAAELEDFSITAHRIASMAVRRGKPVWLIIVVTKTDLYPDQVDEAVAYYSPGSGSPFGAKLDELRALAGGARLSIDVLPVCALESKEAKEAAKGTKRRKGEIAPAKQCAAMLSALEARLGQLSGHV